MLLAFFFYTFPTIHVKTSSGISVSLPYFVNGAKNSFEAYKVTLQNNNPLIRYYQIVPDDCVESLKINDTIVPLNSEINRCNYSDGFSIDLSSYGTSKVVNIDLVIRNNGGKYGINIFPNFQNGYFWFMAFVVFAGLVPLLFKALSKIGLSTLVSTFLLCAIVLRLYYLYHTPYYIRTHDVDGHLDYIMYIVHNFKLPQDNTCWQCYHPSFYYVLAAIWYHLSQFVAILQPYKALQFLSLLLNIGFLVYGLALLKEYLIKPWILFLVSVLFLFWPSLVIHSVRIGNDALVYAAYVASFFHFVRFLKTDAKKHFFLAIVFASLAFMAKTNGIIMMVIMGITLGIKLLRACGSPAFKTLFKLFWVMVVSFTITGGIVFGAKIYDRVKSDAKSLIVSNSNGLGDSLRVGDTLNHFVYFDLKTYINEPYIDPWKDASGRQYFWNYLLKSSVFGEFNTFVSPKSKTPAVVLSMGALIIVLTSFGSLLLRQNRLREEEFALMLNLVISISALMYLRVSVPFACSNDFRYIVPLLFSVLIFHSNFLEKVMQHQFHIAFWTLIGVDMSMICFSVYLML